MRINIYTPGLFITVTAILFFLLTGCTVNDNKKTINSEPTQKTQTNKPVETLNPSISPHKQGLDNKTNSPKYEIVHEIKGVRFDKGVNYYVLIPKVDLSKNNFQNDIKIITKKMVEEKGKKISIDFFDTNEALELDYKLYGDMSLDRTTTKSENEIMAEHCIADFSGDLTTGLYLNSLSFFPSATDDDKEVEKYIQTIEFNPNDYNP